MVQDPGFWPRRFGHRACRRTIAVSGGRVSVPPAQIGNDMSSVPEETALDGGSWNRSARRWSQYCSM